VIPLLALVNRRDDEVIALLAEVGRVPRVVVDLLGFVVAVNKGRKRRLWPTFRRRSRGAGGAALLAPPDEGVVRPAARTGDAPRLRLPIAPRRRYLRHHVD
jgi:hypothetical protein